MIRQFSYDKDGPRNAYVEIAQSGVRKQSAGGELKHSTILILTQPSVRISNRSGSKVVILRSV